MKSATKNNQLIVELEKACEGLVYISETDAEITPLSFDSIENISVTTILKAAGIDRTESVEQVLFSDFFDRLTKEHDWHAAIEKKRSKKFAKLRSVLEKHLKDITVFRVGKIRIDIYVLGKTASGTVAGVKTSAVET